MSLTPDPDFILAAYRLGVFPMATDSRADAPIRWVLPDRRAILPLERFHVPRRLLRTLRRVAPHFTVNRDFAAIVDACAAPAADRPESWINPPLKAAYLQLHRRGYAHSLEVRAEGQIIGGLYGVSIGAAFFGESMFHHHRDASKMALVGLVERLRHCGFQLLDIQFMTAHLQCFGAIEIDRESFQQRLDEAVAGQADFYSAGADFSTAALLQSLSQIS